MQKIAIMLIFLLTSCSTTKSNFYEAQVRYDQHDYASAFNKLYTSAKNHHPQDEYALGYLYYYGLGTIKDQDLARYWITLAADQQYPPAIIALKNITSSHQGQYIPFQKTGAS